MSVDEAFNTFQKVVDANPDQVAEARDRRDVFKKAFRTQPDVTDVFGSGSLRRSTQLRPVHDVDLVIIYDQAAHPSWGEAAGSAEAALDHAQIQVNDLLGVSSGSVDNLVRLAKWRNHAVKCFIDDPDDADAFTVDAMPALRHADGTLLIPEAANDRWVTADPEELIRQVAAHQTAWRFFRPTVRILKQWRHGVPASGGIKSLVMEVLALECMPRSGSRAEALRAFFTAAAVRVNYDIVDPAGHCGLIQPDLDTIALRTALGSAADAATRACAQASDGDTDEALRSWQLILGDAFPAPEAKKSRPGSSSPALIVGRPVKDAPQG